MKVRLLHHLACLVAVWVCGMLSFGQTSKYEMRLAVDILKGKDDSNSKEWAVNVLENSLNEEQDAFALNVLGIAYLHGIGTEPDTVKALAYMEAAGAAGYKLAYHNIGMYYKYNTEGKQDFRKAYEAYEKGAAAGSTSCHYNKGFMLYKGLGCEQNYEAAVDEFRMAADAEHPTGLFMLGLCYRNGYGVEADEDRATFYLNRASILGCSDATEELLKEKAENTHESISLNNEDMIDIPDEMPSIEPYIPNNKVDVLGNYKGFLVTYDWSGTHVLSETPVDVKITNMEDSVNCVWNIGNDTILTKALLTKNGELHFNKEEVRRYDRYSSSYSSLYRFETADICYIDNAITGNLRLYSLDEQEPERPMYLCLKKESVVHGGYDDNNNKVYSYPNPYTDMVNLKFELDEAVPSVKICLYTQGGVMKQSYNLGNLDAGEHTYTLFPSPNERSYIVHVVAGDKVYQTIILKNN